MPFGMNVAAKQGESWDENLLTDDELELMHKNINLVRNSESQRMTYAFVINVEDFGRMKKMLRKWHFKNIEMLVFHKGMHNEVGTGRFISSAEFVIVGYSPNREACQLNFSDHNNPVHRHNVIMVPPLRKKHMHRDGQVVNVTEKHPYVAWKIAKHVCQEGDSVLIVGAGSGSDVLGVNRAGFDVVALENSARQFSHLAGRMDHELANLDEVDAEFADERIGLAKLLAMEQSCFSEVVANIRARSKAAKLQAKATKASIKQQQKLQKRNEAIAARKVLSEVTKAVSATPVTDTSPDVQEVAAAKGNVYEGACVQCDNTQFPSSDIYCDLAACQSVICKNDKCSTPCQQRCADGNVPSPKCDREFCTKACELKHECPPQEK